MKEKILVLLAALCVASTLSAQSLKKVYDESIDPMAQIDKAVSRAKSESRFVICQVGGNWCPWCLRFADFISKDSTISEVIADNFVYIHVNYKPRRQQESAARQGGGNGAQQAEAMMKRLGNPGRFGYPVFVVLDGAGKILHTQDSSFLEEGESYSREKVLRFFRCWTPSALGK
ncbi:MAG: thioredoxin family protein [Bacteroidaceae bacterium]|nr:thioredoxin family protein [Bacteroidaceae bacterium]